MLPLKAIRPHLYGTRRLEAGDEYEAPAERAIALVAERKADFAKTKAKPAPAMAEEKPAPVEHPAVDQTGAKAAAPEMTDNAIDRLRLEATQLGVDVDRRWGVARLQYEISKARR
jgi:hypothetical protein